MATGNLVVQNQDDYLVAAGADIASVRTYNSRGLANDDNGDNWAMSLGRRPLEIAGTPNALGSTVTHTAADGAVAIYAFDGPTEAYVSREGEGAHDTIKLAGGRYTGRTAAPAPPKATTRVPRAGCCSRSTPAARGSATSTVPTAYFWA
ncbi:hypothetical protein HK414_02645 [Ramlibacter terrae]|uniref:Uncharacterized protein n=1 Tax=Ramlibacter terrae TaxID=2732511 RepID=A0ABX6P227_9BURK|nr:hypothetical protein HK414_02645 [Ramlibacter terrae]